MDRLKELCGDICSVIIAILRLLFLTCVMFASSLHLILFAQLEITNIELRGIAWRSRREKDMENLAFVDTLLVNNPELIDYADAHPDMPPPSDEDDGDMDI